MPPYRFYPILIFITTLLALSLRFSGLARFDTLVFDEAHYVKFAQAYLAQQPVFDAHPPLGKYLIALSITLSQSFNQFLNFLANTPINYRWINALAGSLLALVIGKLTTSLSHPGNEAPAQHHQNQLFALLASSFVAIDGLLVVESRYALINIYLLLFGFLSHWLWLIAQNCSQTRKTILYQTLSGMSLGACLSVKWNGLPFLLGILFLEHPQRQPLTPTQKITKACALTLIPCLTYLLLWLPHLSLTTDTLWQIHQKMWQFHQQMGSTTHHYCSPWYSWPLLQRPIAYWYEVKNNLAYDVHNLGNPILWWLSFAAITTIALTLLTPFIPKPTRASKYFPPYPPQPQAIASYLTINYALNWLPWALVGRCTFIYHYMSAVVFSFTALAWLLSRWLTSSNRLWQIIASLMLIAIATALLYFLPLTLGLPLTPEALARRWWLKSWI
jgi:dolichyl-phosphate-mannose-protein mannosyltransferase